MFNLPVLMQKKLKIWSLRVLLFVAVHANAQTIQLTSPNGGESWTGGTTRAITWTYTNIDNIKIEYSLNNGLSWTVISASTPASALSYNWVVPCIGSAQAKVRITSTLQFIQDESNNVFSIPQGTVSILYPNGGESFGTGTGQYVEWQSSGITTLKFQYTTNNGSSWTDIGSFPGTNGYANWIAPATASSQMRIRAFNIENTIDRDSTDALFNVTTSPTENADKFKGGAQDGYNMCSNLPDTIRVTTPNGGESYLPNSTVAINWTYRHVDDIKIEYSTNNGSTWTSIVSGITAGQLSYNWTVPNSPSTQCLVRISSLVGNISDVSNSVFTITSAFVSLTYPNGGESFGTGTGQYIEWTSSSVATVKLEYSTNNGTSWTSIGTATASNKYANWIPPATVGTQYLIRVSDNAVPSVNDVSDLNFSIVAMATEDANKFKGGLNDGYSMNNNRTDSLNITSPNGGEIWTSASTRTISWTYNDVDNISIEYTLNDGQTWTTIAASVPASQLSYSWTLPTTPSYLCRIRIKDLTRPISDQSNTVFTIPNSYVQVTYPNGGESFGTGTGQYIEWEYSDIATVKLEYSTNNGSTWNVIGTAPAANKYANWVVPTVASSQILIRATDNVNPIYTDQSNTVFSSFTSPTENANKFKGGINDGYSMYSFLDSYIKVLSPNGGEIWGNGTTQQIKWSTLNTTENVKIEYSTDNEATWSTIVSSIANSPGVYNWTIAAPVSNICKVRITSVSGALTDKSDNFFTIANTNGIVTNAISGTSFCSGATVPVTFSLNTTFNAGNQFIVQLSDSVGSFAGQVQNIGSITSTTAQTINAVLPVKYYSASLYRLRVISTNPPTIGTNNGTNFTINPLPKVNLGNDTTICVGSSLTLTATNTSSTYLWNTGATTATISASTAGTYSVRVTNSCGITRDTIIIQQRQLPSVNLGADKSICINSATTLDAGTNAATYLWSTGAVSQQISAVIPGTYSVTVSNSCGNATDNIVITNKPATVVNLGNDQGLCSGGSIVLNAGNAGATYLWSNGSTTQSITVTTPANYSVDVNAGCGVVSDQISIYNGTFTVNAGVDKSICTGGSTTLTATGATGYTWSTSQTTSSINVSPTANTTYTVTATNIYNCTSTDQVVVTVNPILNTTFSQVGPYCSGATIPALPTTSTNGISGTWSPAINNTSTTTYTFTQATGQCGTSTTMAVTINALPTATITPAGSTSLCQGGSVVLNANTGAGLTYVWKKDGANISGSTAASYTATTAGSYSVLVINTNNCSATSTAVDVTVSTNVTPTFTQFGPYCSGASIPSLPTTSNNGISGTWSPTINNTATTAYTFTPTAGQCATTATMTITINPATVPTFAQVGPYTSGATIPALPTTSNNSITGTWSPAINNTATTTYTFTPSAGQCGTTTTMTITINQPLQYTLTANDSTVCAGTTVTLSVNLVGTYRAGTVHCNGIPTAVVDVTNPVTGKTWMDRNLGASRAATSSTDAQAYGDLYQWGRGADGHQCRNSATTTTLSSTDQPGHGNFITTNSSPLDWRSTQNTNLWQGVNGVNNPCPSGYRIPTETELNDERLSWSQNNNVGAFSSPLKFSLAGYRDGNSSALHNQGGLGLYWTNSINSSNSKYLRIELNNANISIYYRVDGYSVRCIKQN